MKKNYFKIELIFKMEDASAVDYALTELENALEYNGVDYTLRSTDTWVDAKYSQEMNTYKHDANKGEKEWKKKH